MVGVGTTALYAVASGHNALVADLDPLACLLTRGKTIPIDPSVLLALIHAIMEETGPIGYRAPVGLTPAEAILELEQSTPCRAPPSVFHWFHPTIARDLARVLTAAHNVLRRRPAGERDAVMTVIASTIRRVSRADPQPVSGLEVTDVNRRKLAAGLRFDLQAELVDRAESLSQGYAELLHRPRLGKVRVIQGDARTWSRVCLETREQPELQILSPPYLNAIEYWRRHRLEYFWLGLVDRDEYVSMSHRFFGARAVRKSIRTGLEDGSSPSVLQLSSSLAAAGFSHDADSVRQYFCDAAVWLKEVGTVCAAANGDVYIIVGPSIRRGQLINTPKLLSALAQAIGLELVGGSVHRIINQRMQFPLRNDGGIRTETVLHLRSRK